MRSPGRFHLAPRVLPLFGRQLHCYLHSRQAVAKFLQIAADSFVQLMAQGILHRTENDVSSVVFSSGTTDFVRVSS